MAGVRELFAGSMDRLRNLDYVQSNSRFYFHRIDRGRHGAHNILALRNYWRRVMDSIECPCIKKNCISGYCM